MDLSCDNFKNCTIYLYYFILLTKRINATIFNKRQLTTEIKNNKFYIFNSKQVLWSVVKRELNNSLSHLLFSLSLSHIISLYCYLLTHDRCYYNLSKSKRGSPMGVNNICLILRFFDAILFKN